jgi:uncharacterized membrane protein YbjE (DUF340 family)
MKKLIAAMVLGIFAGYFKVLPPIVVANTGSLITYAFAFALIFVGIDMGSNREALLRVKKMGLHCFILPLSIAVGTIIGSIAVGVFLNFTWSEAAAIGSGFGWYSLAPAILTKMKGSEFATVSFLYNMMRESMTFLSIPLVLKYFGKMASIAPAAATSMDITLPVYQKILGQEYGLLAFISGITLTILVPLLVPLFASIG